MHIYMYILLHIIYIHDTYIRTYLHRYIHTGLEKGGVASQNENHFEVIVNHFGKVNCKTANHF